MTAYTWVGGTGDWDVGSNWSPSSPAGPPTAADTATISAGGPAYTVVIDSADVAKSLTENSSSATVDDAGSLTLGRTFALSAGTFILGSGGTLSGGTTKVTGGTFVCDGGTLSGVTYDGTLDLSETGAFVQLANGTVVNDDAGPGVGMIDDTGSGSQLDFDNTQTFNNATINLGSASGGYISYLSEDDLTGAGTVLTLGSNVTIDESGNGGITDTSDSGDGIVNKGNINQTTSGGNLVILGNSFTNSGTITAASSGGALTIEYTAFANSGTLAISNGEAVTIDATNLSNTGSITLGAGSSLYLGGSFTRAELGKVTNSGGTVYIQGTLDNAGGTLDGSSGLGQAVLDGGTIQGGTVTPSGLGGFSNQRGNTLRGVTYDGALDVSGSGVSVRLAGGTVVNGTLDLGSRASARLAGGTVVNDAAGTGPGTINDTGVDSTLYFVNTQTFNNATINLGSSSRGYSYLIEYDPLHPAGTILTLGSNVTIDESGNGVIFGDIVNEGNINQTASGGTLYIRSDLTNNGTITAASSGGVLNVDNGTFTNAGTLAVSNGETVNVETAVTGTGTETISGAATLEFGAAVSTSTTVGSQNIGFAGTGALDLTDPASFYGEVSGFAAGDEVELLGAWAFSGISEAGGLTTLTLASGATTHAFEFVGGYTQGDFKVTSGSTSTITHT
jgi:hypothetical protein